MLLLMYMYYRYRVDSEEVTDSHNEWSRGNGNHDKGDLWDSNEGAGNTISFGFDLSDFAAAAVKFREETKALGKDKGMFEGVDNYADMKRMEDDAIAKLIAEQSEFETFGEGAPVGDEEEDVPDWARDDDDPAEIPKTSDTKRNLLLEVMSR